jgi:hypothetical protein
MIILYLFADSIVVSFSGQKSSPNVRSSGRKVEPKNRATLDEYVKLRDAKLKKKQVDQTGKTFLHFSILLYLFIS